MLIILFTFIAGCQDYKYCIEMKPCDGGVERKIIWSGNVPDQEQERIAELYEKQVKPNAFYGKFKGKLPSDVGGTGFYTYFLTNMGTATVYSEHFRGQDNLLEQLEYMKVRVDRVIDFLIGWLEYELEDEPNFENLRTFCNNNLREDCKNVICYFWLANTLAEYEDNAEEEFGMRVMHYLSEHNYLSPQEIALASQGCEEAILRAVRRLIANKMGYSEPTIIAKKLIFLTDTEHMEASMEKYITTTELYKKIWEKAKLESDDPNTEPPDVGDFFSEMLDFELDSLLITHGIEVKLVCKNKPFYTNGQWNEKANQVTWCRDIARNYELPTFFYASWSVPDKKFQKEHFGRVVLSDKDLANYCAWRKGLDEEKGKEWDNLLLSLNPTQDLKRQVSSFRFSDDSQKRKEPDVEDRDLAKKGRELILAGLKAK